VATCNLPPAKATWFSGLGRHFYDGPSATKSQGHNNFSKNGLATKTWLLYKQVDGMPANGSGIRWRDCTIIVDGEGVLNYCWMRHVFSFSSTRDREMFKQPKWRRWRDSSIISQSSLQVLVDEYDIIKERSSSSLWPHLLYQVEVR